MCGQVLGRSGAATEPMSSRSPPHVSHGLLKRRARAARKSFRMSFRNIRAHVVSPFEIANIIKIPSPVVLLQRLRGAAAEAARRYLERYQYKSLWNTQEIQDRLHMMWESTQLETSISEQDAETAPPPPQHFVATARARCW